MATMNVSDVYDEDNATTSSHSQPRCDELRRYPTGTALASFYAMLMMLHVAVAVGVPGNILSAIVWIRRRIAGKMSSAVYLAALSINDLVHLLAESIFVCDYHMSVCEAERLWLCYGALYMRQSTGTLEHLLVLCFSVERLIAVLRPLQVSRNTLRVYLCM